MSQNLRPLIIDFLEWLNKQPREYHEVMDAWRTACPRLTVWEDAVDEGLVAREGRFVVVTAEGVARSAVFDVLTNGVPISVNTIAA